MSETIYHRLLARQMRRFNVDVEGTPQLKELLEAVNKSYNQFEKEKNIQDNNSSKLIQKISQANANLTSIIETIDSFNYHVSHDLKTIIINNISLAKMGTKYFDKDNKEKLEQVLEKLQANSTAGMTVIEKYLKISKFETQAKEDKPQMYDLRTQINQVMKHTNLDGLLKVRILHEDFTELLINEVSLSSMIQNFITNSYKYKKPNVKPEITFRFEKKNDFNYIITEDNGIGIDLEKHRDKIFKPFVRIDNAEIEGSGVGLFIVKKIVTSLGGTIDVESQLGVGTKFIVKLPV